MLEQSTDTTAVLLVLVSITENSAVPDLWQQAQSFRYSRKLLSIWVLLGILPKCTE
jgi:hypothetical protein